jgi:hypothetical protein
MGNAAETNVPTPTRQQIKRWGSALYRRTVLIGALQRAAALKGLLAAVQRQDRLAVRILADAIAHHFSADVRTKAAAALAQLTTSAAINEVWQVWQETNDPALLNLLHSLGQPATNPPALRVISALVLNPQTPALKPRSEDVQAALDLAQQDSEWTLAARDWLAQLTNKSAGQILCAAWNQTHADWLKTLIRKQGWVPETPPEACVAGALLNAQVDVLTRGGAEIIRPLCCEYLRADSETHSWARYALLNLSEQTQVDTLAQIWFSSRDAALAELLQTSQRFPEQPDEVRLGALLKFNPQNVLPALQPALIPLLVEFMADADPQIRAAADMVLNHLPDGELPPALCEHLMQHPNARLEAICLEKHYLPATPVRQALFLFLTQQWQAYQTLDFDFRLLTTLIAAAKPELKERIAALIRTSGRTDFLPILSGGRQNLDLYWLPPEDINAFAHMLGESGEWERLWQLALQTDYFHSLKIIARLHTQGFLPAKADEGALFKTLTQFLGRPAAANAADLREQTPPGLRKALLNVSGRINTFAFSPTEHHLAIGTNQRQVAIWDYHRGKLLRIQRGFSRSIGAVGYAKDGALWIGERTISNDPCGIYRLAGEQLNPVGTVSGSVIGFVPIGADRVISLGRDQIARTWDPAYQQPVSRRELTVWPRSFCVDEANSLLYLCAHRPYLYNLADLTQIKPMISQSDEKNSMISACAVTARGDFFAARSQHQLYRAVEPGQQNLSLTAILPIQHNVVGLCAVSGQEEIVLAEQDGKIAVFPAENTLTVRRLNAGAAVTAVEVSADGKSMAIGHSASQVAFWDLQTLSLPALAQQPIGGLNKQDLQTLQAIESGLTAGVADEAARYLMTILQFRFRYDIEIDQTPHLAPGEFDIFLEPDEPAVLSG